ELFPARARQRSQAYGVVVGREDGERLLKLSATNERINLLVRRLGPGYRFARAQNVIGRIEITFGYVDLGFVADNVEFVGRDREGSIDHRQGRLKIPSAAVAAT